MIKFIKTKESVWKKLMRLKKTLECHSLSEVLEILLEVYNATKNTE